MKDYSTAEKHKLDQLVEQWVAVDPNAETRSGMLLLQKQEKYAELEKCLLPRIAFGTAGLRSAMAPGFAHMNDVTVLQAAQGLVAYVAAHGGSSLAIGYDHRHNLKRYAELTAAAALAQNFTVYFLGNVSDSKDSRDGCRHTPLVPFTVDHFGAGAGVMVTALHNPARDNGYKVYWGNGCQIVPPHDAGIAESIMQNLQPWDGVWDTAALMKQGLALKKLQVVGDEMLAAYIKAVHKLVRHPKVSFGFVYTPIHGVGLDPFQKMAAAFGVEVNAVAEQARPDPDFPTVGFPNPEEKGALDLAIAKAEKEGLRLVVANDPDADRFSVAVKRAHGFQQLTGNEIGALFAAYVLEKASGKTAVVNSTVSSQLLRPLAEQHGARHAETLTGFKWIGNKAIELEQEYNVPFAYEEAIGYMLGVVHDKDGVAAAAVWLQLWEAWFAQGQDPFDKLAEIYEKCGWHMERNGYYRTSVEQTNQVFAAIRTSKPYPEQIGKMAVLLWRDLTTGYDSSTANHKPLLPVDLLSQMITATVAVGAETVRFTCRGSGTEPKLKVYIEGVGRTRDGALGAATECWHTLREEWFAPFGLAEVCNW